MSNENIQVGIIGAGGNTTKLHIPGLQAQDSVKIMSVVNRAAALSQRIANKFNIPQVADDWQ